MRDSIIHRCLDRCRLRWHLKRIKRIPAHKPFTTHILGPPLQVLDSRSFYYTYKEIFLRETYAFESRSSAPQIIDGGANIGLSVIFFKQLWPDAHITAFEPDAEVFRVLRANVGSFQFSNVTLVNAALWKEDTTVKFFAQGADAGRLFRPQPGGTTQTVVAQRLCQYLTCPIDMLKLDIEGAEADVLLDSVDSLSNARNLLIEYHSFDGEVQRLDELLRVLRSAGFRMQIHTQFAARKPLMHQELQLGMDLQLNVFAFQDASIEGGKTRQPDPTTVSNAA